MARYDRFAVADLSRKVVDQFPPCKHIELIVREKSTDVHLVFAQIEGEERPVTARRAVDLITKHLGIQPQIDSYYVRWELFGATVTALIGYSEIRSSDLLPPADPEVIE